MLFGRSGWLPAEENEMIVLEEMFLHLSTAFGNNFQEKRGFIFPVQEQFNYTNLHDETELKNLTAQLAALFFLDSARVSVSIFYATGLQEYARNVGGISTSTPTITQHWEEQNETSHAFISINSEMLDNSVKVVYLIATALARLALEKKQFNFNRLYAKYLPDVTVIFFGFGIFIENIRLLKLIGVQPHLEFYQWE
jgi:hypothetical protein